MAERLSQFFWDWNRPVLEHAVEALTTGWSGGVLDLSDRVMVVPTAETGRRLRESLAREVAKQGGAVMAPYVWSPEAVLGQGLDAINVATAVQERMAWTRVLSEVQAADVQALMPRLEEISKDEGWLLGMASSLGQLKKVLGAGGLDMAAVLDVVKEDRDVERWSDLAALEKRLEKVLNQMGLVELQQAKREVAQQGSLPEEIKKVWVLAVADPPALLKLWLKRVAAKAEVEVKVFVHAAQTAEGLFDEFGTPDWDLWGQGKSLDAGLNDQDLWMEGSPEEQARRVVKLMKKFATKGMEVGVGCADMGLLPQLEGELSAEGLRVFDPAGKNAQGHALVVLLRGWLALIRSESWEELRAFFNQADVLHAVSVEEGGQKLTQSQLLKALDALHEKRLPATWKDAIHLCEQEQVKQVLIQLGDRVVRWKALSLEDGLRELLDWIYGNQEFHTSKVEHADYAKLMGEALNLAMTLDEARTKSGSRLSTAGLLEMLLEELSGTDLMDVRGEVDLVLHGWLELHWEPAPALVIAGFNEESVPGVVTGDAFLPDGLRRRLKLACQASRRARDAYLLRAMLEQRRIDGAFNLVLGKVNAQGDGLRPSRLLFDCPEEQLVARVRKLFPAHHEGGGGESPRSDVMKVPPRTLAFQLRPRWVEDAVTRISPSMLKEYLRCPFRFYLRHVLKMSEVTTGLNEASVMVFGDLIHEVLQSYAVAPEMHDCVDESVIAGWLEQEVEKAWLKRFGDRPLFSVILQKESALQRVRAASKTLAHLRTQGWRTVLVEGEDLTRKESSNGIEKAGNDKSGTVKLEMMLGDLPLVCRIDRVDRRVTADGFEEFLLLDYKTGKAEGPEKMHLGKMSEEEQLDEMLAWQYCEVLEKRWKDLQLPLYVAAMKQMKHQAPVIAGYFHLPAVSSDSKVNLWTGLDESLLADAWRCAQEAVDRIRRGVFWPPSAVDERFENFPFLLGDAEASVDPTELLMGSLKEGAGS